MTPDNANYFVIAMLATSAGIYVLFRGLKPLKIRSLITKTKTSQVSSLNSGMVKVVGTAKAFKPLVDPIFKEPCVYYNIRVLVQMLNGWEYLDKKISIYTPFLVTNGEQSIPVLPRNAETYLNPILDVIAFKNYVPTSNDNRITRFLEDLGEPTVHTIRVILSVIREGDPISIVGSVASPQRILNRKNAILLSMMNFGRKATSDPELLKTLDRNKDGEIDKPKLDLRMLQYKKKIETLDDNAISQTISDIPVVICKKSWSPLIISGKEEKSLLHSLLNPIWINISLGLGITIGSIGLYSLYYFLQNRQ